MFRNVCLAVGFIIAVVSAQAQTIDTALSKVSFKIKNMKFKTVEGTFSNMTGTVDYDGTTLTYIDACISAETVNTESKKRDKHLKNEDFFHVDAYPNICFESSEIVNQNNTLVAKGTLELHGVSKSVEIPLTINDNTISGQLTIKRLDYKLGESTGTFMVGDDVEIFISCVIK